MNSYLILTIIFFVLTVVMLLARMVVEKYTWRWMALNITSAIYFILTLACAYIGGD